MRPLPILAALLGSTVLLGGCASAPARETVAAEVAPAAPVYTQPGGGIWQAGQSIALFEDRKARNVGDLLTILLIEQTTAKSSAATSTNKETNGKISAPELFGSPVTVGGKEVLSATLNSEHDFAGTGDSSQSNKLEGNITVSVVGVEFNGNLLVRGEKKLKLNQGSEFVRIEGTVRPTDISPDNTIPSSRIANAKIAYGGDGTLAEANTKGWLARFFSSPWMPF